LEQGRLLGLLGAIGLQQANEVQRELWVQEALATAAIEGQQLNLESLRSSVAHRLALDGGLSRGRAEFLLATASAYLGAGESVPGHHRHRRRAAPPSSLPLRF
jgi:Fic family protein